MQPYRIQLPAPRKGNGGSMPVVLPSRPSMMQQLDPKGHDAVSQFFSCFLFEIDESELLEKIVRCMYSASLNSNRSGLKQNYKTVTEFNSTNSIKQNFKKAGFQFLFSSAKLLKRHNPGIGKFDVESWVFKGRDQLNKVFEFDSNEKEMRKAGFDLFMSAVASYASSNLTIHIMNAPGNYAVRTWKLDSGMCAVRQRYIRQDQNTRVHIEYGKVYMVVPTKPVNGLTMSGGLNLPPVSEPRFIERKRSGPREYNLLEFNDSNSKNNNSKENNDYGNDHWNVSKSNRNINENNNPKKEAEFNIDKYMDEVRQNLGNGLKTESSPKQKLESLIMLRIAGKKNRKKRKFIVDKLKEAQRMIDENNGNVSRSTAKQDLKSSNIIQSARNKFPNSENNAKKYANLLIEVKDALLEDDSRLTNEYNGKKYKGRLVLGLKNMVGTNRMNVHEILSQLNMNKSQLKDVFMGKTYGEWIQKFNQGAAGVQVQNQINNPKTKNQIKINQLKTKLKTMIGSDSRLEWLKTAKAVAPKAFALYRHRIVQPKVNAHGRMVQLSANDHAKLNRYLKEAAKQAVNGSAIANNAQRVRLQRAIQSAVLRPDDYKAAITARDEYHRAQLQRANERAEAVKSYINLLPRNQLDKNKTLRILKQNSNNNNSIPISKRAKYQP